MKTMLLLETDFLSYLDAMKLSIPFLFSILLIWIKDIYEKNNEKKYKNEHIWRALKQQFDDCKKGIEALNITWEKFSKHDIIVYFSLDIPQSLLDYAKRLTELEYKKSYIYSGFISNAEIVKCGHKNLQALLNQATFCNYSEDNSTKLKKAIGSQLDALKNDFITLAESQLELMEYISKKYHKDGQEIDKFRSIIDEACKINYPIRYPDTKKMDIN